MNTEKDNKNYTEKSPSACFISENSKLISVVFGIGESTIKFVGRI